MRTYFQCTKSQILKFLCCLFLGALNSLNATSGVWINPAAGNWDNNTNWSSGAFPNADGETAGFIASPTIGGTITSTQNITIANLIINDPATPLLIQFPPPFNLTFSNASGFGLSTIFNKGAVSNVIDTPITLTGNLKIYTDNEASPIAAPLIISSVISGTGNLIVGRGSLPLGTSPVLGGTSLSLEANNTFDGFTSVLDGLLQLNSNFGHSIPGGLNIQGGQVQTEKTQQLDPASPVNIFSGLLDLQSFPLDPSFENVDTVTVASRGSLIDSAYPGLTSGVLNIANSGFPMSINNGSIVRLPRINFPNGGTVVFASSQSGPNIVGDTTETAIFTFNFNNQTGAISVFSDLTRNIGDAIMYNPAIINVSPFTLQGSGTLLVLGSLPNNSFPSINITGGTLQIGDTSATVIQSSGQISFNNFGGGVLQGFGTFGSGSASVTNSSIVQPGDSLTVGDLSIDGNYTQVPDGILRIKADGSGGNDRLNVTGVVQLNGTLQFVADSGVTPGDYLIIDNTGGPANISGTFSSFMAIFDETTAPGLAAQVIYNAHQVIVRVTTGCPVNPPSGVKPPRHLRGKLIQNKFLTETDHINQLTWRPSKSSDIVLYRVYRNLVLIGFVNANAPLVFNDHTGSEERSFRYGVTAVNNLGQESPPARITFPRKSSSSD